MKEGSSNEKEDAVKPSKKRKVTMKKKVSREQFTMRQAVEKEKGLQNEVEKEKV